MSAVKRLLGRDDIVIADGLNYIKGFRYQLYCEAKALQTPSCVVRSRICLKYEENMPICRILPLFVWLYGIK
jgi:tRNA uridine 5-carbamoylmethylation protein Kti12